MKTRTPALITAGTLALALTACGGGAPEETTEAEAVEETEAGGGGIADLLSKLSENTQDVTNYTLDLDLTMPDPELGEIDLTMTYEVMDDPEAAQVTMVMPFLGDMLLELAAMGGEVPDLTAEELGTTVLIVPAEGESLMSNHNGLHEVDTPWARGVQDTADFAPEEMFDISALPDLVGAFAEIDQIEEAGTEEISGVETTLVEGTMTSEEIDALDAEQQLAVQELIGDVSESVDVSIWIDGDGFPMRLDFSDEEADISMVFSALGETSFEIPGEDEITDL
ncbi:hypothetical protein Q8791_02480 [Nocardiopsis sp. CT-R113]|uniref:Lipoprotein n=1 Tax=Nocardiopsis codii TaxID=3065942 RepID=A0ABU7K2K3_9ACTN|nr:hypothetical protein [Nocardiopsis sp. CT-R113]MEE2036089.1 hypothetical protein [Nocardiopsis sp. CT-R113]